MAFDVQASGSIFKVFSSIFKKHSVRAVLVGGYAVISYKIQRTTFDIDFMLTVEDYGKIESEMFSIGFSIFNKTDAFVQLRGDKPGLRDIDFLLGDPVTVDGLISKGKNIQIAGESFTVPSPLHLIAMKLHSLQESSKPSTIPEPELKFPVCKETMAPPSIRSLDEINAWIEHDYALFYDRKKMGEEKKKMSVNKRFVLK